MISLETPVQYLKGIGPVLGARLVKLGIATVYDFLYFFPRTYEDRTKIPPILAIVPNEVQLVTGKIVKIHEDTSRQRMSILTIDIADDEARISALFFNQGFLLKTLKIGDRILVRGKVEYNTWTKHHQITVSEHELIRNPEEAKTVLGKIVPVYPLVHGLTNLKMRQQTRLLLEQCARLLTDPLTAQLRSEFNLIELARAIQAMHYPDTQTQLEAARYRLAFDEFFYLQLALIRRKEVTNQFTTAPILSTNGPLINAHVNRLPYTLTKAQQTAIADIARDVQSGRAMNRLIQGDVGSGKTDVAVMALLFALQSGFKGAIMAPTEVLAQQHYLKFKQYFESLQATVVLIRGKMKAAERRNTLALLNSEAPLIIVGTHALIEDAVTIEKLGLVVVDEQHRFGVVQRLRLKEKAVHAHSLFLTATPIPRSLMLTCFGDLDKTIIDELPPGRVPPKTVFFKPDKLPDIYGYARRQIQAGHQVYVVYPLVEESEKLDLKAAAEGWEDLKRTVFPDYSVALLHGRMRPDEKQQIMDEFKAGKSQILVSTTVIEVGIDVPNATMMIIHHAERFGLSQLHQLRGRIGRGQATSFCFLVAEPKTKTAQQRLKAMLDTHDGFKIAEHDLQIRGPGDVMGTRQSGLPEFNVADLIRDEKILLTARLAAYAIIKADPNLTAPDHCAIQHALLIRSPFSFHSQLN